VTPSFAGLRSTRPREGSVRAIVLHSTGGIRPPLGVFQTLRARKTPRAPDGLSVHFVVGVDGEVVQLAPLDLVCLHAGDVNEWTIGVEICSPLYARTALWEVERRRGVERERYSAAIHTRRPVELLGETEAQTRAVIELCEYLCDVRHLPRRVPLESDGSVMRRQMMPLEFEGFLGVMGHLHCHPAKRDPGVRIFERLRARWAL
jgi:N-acetyl-anhydromuramyl-L-alanine amidase AmpD